jgi:UDP-4-amino-4,6-dideoxy-N-acetyl-beta-L-altrosamine N-acetyltransferase
MISGKKIHLRAIEDYDLAQLQSWRNNPELRQFFREYRDLSMENQKQWFQKIQNDKTQTVFSIVIKGQNRLIGCCGLHNISWTNRVGEFGIYIDTAKDVRGFGYGFDALNTLLNYGFNELNLNRIWGEVYSNNAAIKLYEKMGFQYEGLLRQTYFYDGQYFDSKIVGMLAYEFRENLGKL